MLSFFEFFGPERLQPTAATSAKAINMRIIFRMSLSLPFSFMQRFCEPSPAGLMPQVVDDDHVNFFWSVHADCQGQFDIGRARWTSDESNSATHFILTITTHLF